MKRVILEYDEATAQITDATGCMVGTWGGLKSFDSTNESVPASTLIKLKEAGFDAEEIIAMNKAGML